MAAKHPQHNNNNPDGRRKSKRKEIIMEAMALSSPPPPPSSSSGTKRRSIVRSGKSPHYHPSNNNLNIMDSFRDFLDDLPIKKEKRGRKGPAGDPPDEVGEAMTNLLNSNPAFSFRQRRRRRPRPRVQTAAAAAAAAESPDDENDKDEHDDLMITVRPVLSAKNANRLRAVLRCLFTLLGSIRPRQDIPTILQITWHGLVWNTKPGGLVWFGIVFLGWLFCFLSVTAATTALFTVWTFQFCSLVVMMGLALFVDWKELSSFLPQWFHQMASTISKGIVWIDLTVLQGKRYRGREWNRDDFELEGRANTADSSRRGQSLAKNPPPCIRQVGLELSIIPEQIQRPEWSVNTTKHVAAINYSYLHLRKEVVRKHYMKLRRAVFKKSESDESFVSAKLEPKTDFIVPGSGPAGVTLFDPARPPPVSSTEGSLNGLPPRDDELLPSSLDDIEDSFLIDALHSKSSNGNSESLTEVEDHETGRGLPLRLEDILEDNSSDAYEDMDDETADSSNAKNQSLDSGSDAATDMNWMDVGAEIGIKLLGSAAVQKAMASQDTAETISTIKERVESHMANHKALATSSSNVTTHCQYRKFDSFDERLLQGSITEEPHHSNFDRSNTLLSLPVNPMWTSASNAISPTQSTCSADASNRSINDALSLPSITRMPLTGTESNVKSPSSMQEQSANDVTTPIIANVTKAQASFGDAATSGSSSKLAIEIIRDVDESDKVLIKSAQSTPREDAAAPVLTSPVAPRRPLLQPGTKIVVPIFPYQPGLPKPSKSRYQMATVVTSRRLCVYPKNKLPVPGKRGTNCLSITVKLDKSFLRNGEFATMTLRIMDDWGSRYMPKHSKLPLGSCVATSFGLGILVGWRVEDDCHIVRSLWQRRGPGSALAYLRRDSIHATVEAANGFEVETKVGSGTVVAYTNGGCDFRRGRYFVSISDEGRLHGQVVELDRSDVLSCKSAQFVPVVEYIRAAAQYQLQIDFYEEVVKEDKFGDGWEENRILGEFSKHFNIIWKSFLRAIDEDDEFDEGMNAFVQSCVNFLEQLDAPDGATLDSMGDLEQSYVITTTESSHSSQKTASVNRKSEKIDSGFWLMDNVFGLFGGQNEGRNDEPLDNDAEEAIEIQCGPPRVVKIEKRYKRAFAVLRTLMRTVTIAQAACADEPDFKLALSFCYELLLFVKTVIKVQRKNMNPESLMVYRRAWEEIVSVFGPVKDRLTKIGEGIAERIEKQGRRAKVRVLRFVDIIVSDDALLSHLEQGDWERCAEQIEDALVRSKIIDQSSREHYHKTAQFLYNHFATAIARNQSAGDRNNEKFAQALVAVQLLASPRKSILKLFLQDWVLDVLVRIFVRVFAKEELASRMLTIHSSNFQTLRQFRMLKDFTIAGKLWIPLLDAADEEISLMVSNLPNNTKEYLSPLSSLFSLCVAQFHKINQGDLTKDWLDFLIEDDAVAIIHDIDMKLILALESFSRDVKEMMVVLPYYSSIDVDILNLVDELNIHELVKEASVALEDEDRLREFIREKATMALERFLDYLPKMSIPVEKRDLADGWTLTCRGADGGDLTLTDLTIKRENLSCQVMGGDAIFFPMLGGADEEDVASTTSQETSTSRPKPKPTKGLVEETSILDHIRDMILNAQYYGCWELGVGGVNHPPSDRCVASALHDVPVSSVLNCGIELWKNLEIDDDELLEIAIRDVSYQIQLHQNKEEGIEMIKECKEDDSSFPLPESEDLSEPFRQRFNPRVDATVLYLEIKNLTFNLENFLFRIEKHESKRTIFDPAFDGSGSVLVRNVSVKLRVECVKDYVGTNSGSGEVAIPVLQLNELDVSLEHVKLHVQNTGADWLLNKVVEGFGDRFTEIMSANLREQVRGQIKETLENLNNYFASHPDVLLGLLDISLEDLEEKIVYV